MSRVVLGTAAALDPAIVPAVLAAEGPDRIAVGIDARDGLVAIRGLDRDVEPDGGGPGSAGGGGWRPHDHLYRCHAGRDARGGRTWRVRAGCSAPARQSSRAAELPA